MTILSFYIQHNDCFVSIGLQGKTIEKHITLGKTETQAMALIPFIQGTWEEAGKPKITCLMSPRGPGAFTSLRVGLAAAQGLELAFPNAKIFSPTHFDVLAYAASLKTTNPFIVLIDSKKGDFYGQIWEEGKAQQPLTYTNESLNALLNDNLDMQVIGDWEIFSKALDSKMSFSPNDSIVVVTRESMDPQIKSEDDKIEQNRDERKLVFQDRLINNDKNLATCQIELYEKNQKLRENPDYQKFQPFYLYLPEYVKRKPM